MRISDWSSRVLFRSPNTTICANLAANSPATFCNRRGSQHEGRDHRFPLKSRRSIVRAEVGSVPACRVRSEEHTSELQSLMRISYAIFCLKKKKNKNEIQPIRINNSDKLSKIPTQ